MKASRQKYLVFFIGLVSLIYCAIEAMGEGDLYIYLCAAGDLREGINIFRKAYIQSQYHYYYSVWFASLLQPFYYLPYYGVKFGWLLIHMAMYLHLLWLLSQQELVKSLDEKKYNWFLFLSFVFSFRFLHENIHTSQITILILWCSVNALMLIRRGLQIRGAFLLAAVISIKLLPLVFLPYLFYRGYFKACLFSVLFLAGLYLLPSLYLGHAYNKELLSGWWELINPSQKQHVLDVDERSFHGLSTLLATLLVEHVPDKMAMDLKRNLFDVSYEAYSKILLAARLILVAGTLFFLKGKTFKPSVSAERFSIEVSYLLMIIPLIFPHQQHYAFLFICPAATLILYYLFRYWKHFTPLARKIIVSLLIISYLSANLKILLGEFNRYYEHFKILTYGALLLIPLLASVSRAASRSQREIAA